MLANAPPHVDLLLTPNPRFHMRAIVYVLIALFGLGTWTNLSGIWIELPVIVPVLPESWQLPAKLALLINSANVFPIGIVFASLIFKLNTASVEIPVNFVLLCASITFAIAFAYLWDKTAYLFGTKQSVYLMFLCFFTAIADCMSSTTFIPFLHRYEPIYLNAYFMGEALTALLPAMFGVAQGIGKSHCQLVGNGSNVTYVEMHHEPRFSVRTYFLLLSVLPFCALLAFFTLCMMETGRSKTPPPETKSKRSEPRVFIVMDNMADLGVIENTIKTINRIETIYSLIVFQSSAMLYGLCPGLTTFSLNAYSPTTFHYTIIISQFAYPALTLFGAFISNISSRSIYALYVASTGTFIYIFLTAKMAPCPPLVNQMLGHVLIFSAWIAIHLTCSCTRLFMGNYFRKTLGHRGLVWFGVGTQLGALFGSGINFLLTNTFQLFEERHICDRTTQCP